MFVQRLWRQKRVIAQQEKDLYRCRNANSCRNATVLSCVYIASRFVAAHHCCNSTCTLALFERSSSIAGTLMCCLVVLAGEELACVLVLMDRQKQYRREQQKAMFDAATWV